MTSLFTDIPTFCSFECLLQFPFYTSRIFRNIDLKYRYGDTRLKEEISLTQAARDNLPDPRDYNMNPNNAHLVFITQLDLDSAPEVFARNEKVKKKVFEGHDKITFRNLKGDIKFFLPVDWAFREVDRDT